MAGTKPKSNYKKADTPEKKMKVYKDRLEDDIGKQLKPVDDAMARILDTKSKKKR